jgi:hypothetical protein
VEPPEYAIAGTYQEFMTWRAIDPEKRGRVIYLFSAERAKHGTCEVASRDRQAGVGAPRPALVDRYRGAAHRATQATGPR